MSNDEYVIIPSVLLLRIISAPNDIKTRVLAVHGRMKASWCSGAKCRHGFGYVVT